MYDLSLPLFLSLSLSLSFCVSVSLFVSVTFSVFFSLSFPDSSSYELKNFLLSHSPSSRVIAWCQEEWGEAFKIRTQIYLNILYLLIFFEQED